MSTNYYAYTRNRNLVYEKFDHDHCQDEFEISDCEALPDFGYLIHIGKCSCGWKPLFATHTDAYSSVRELQEFFTSHADDFLFYDEYFEQLPFEKLKKELIDWNKDAETIYYKKTDPRGRFERVEPGEPYDFTGPIDHIEYMRVYPSPFHNGFWNDPDGYNFTTDNFS